MMELPSEFIEFFGGRDAFDNILAWDDEIFRAHKNRRTYRFVKDGKGYFVKAHRAVGWKEILKNLSSLRLPVLGAQNEVRAIKRLEALRIDTMKIVGFGKRGVPPAWLESFIITHELTRVVSLEAYCGNWRVEPPEPFLKFALVKKVARVARTLHRNGLNHRDFYLCHFFLDLSRFAMSSGVDDLKLYLIDLHRMQVRNRTPLRWVVKDVAGLLFSSMEIGLTRRDLFRFMKWYSNKPLRTILQEESLFWGRVYEQAAGLYRKHYHRPVPIHCSFP